MFIEGARIRAEQRANAPEWVRDIGALAPLFDGKRIEFRQPVTFVVGENGSGKSTLIEAVGEQFGLDPRGGRAAISGGGAYILDEPEAALSFTSCLQLIAKFSELGRAGSQIICATIHRCSPRYRMPRSSR